LIKYIVLTAATVALAAPSFAQRPPQRTPEEIAAAFTAADANKDAKLDKVEFKNYLPEQMRSMIDDERLAQIVTMRDTDKDGFISKAEASAPMQRPAQ
jgi:Ca2+-binding EF-hand superfamily protein